MAGRTKAQRALDDKVSDVAMRCVEHLKSTLGPLDRYLTEPDVEEEVARFGKAAIAYAAAIVTFDGNPAKAIKTLDVGLTYVQRSAELLRAVNDLHEKDTAPPCKS